MDDWVEKAVVVAAGVSSVDADAEVEADARLREALRVAQDLSGVSPRWRSRQHCQVHIDVAVTTHCLDQQARLLDDMKAQYSLSRFQNAGQNTTYTMSLNDAARTIRADPKTLQLYPQAPAFQPLYPHQALNTAHITQQYSQHTSLTILSAEMGLSKTYIISAAIKAIHQAKLTVFNDKVTVFHTTCQAVANSQLQPQGDVTITPEQGCPVPPGCHPPCYYYYCCYHRPVHHAFRARRIQLSHIPPIIYHHAAARQLGRT